MGKIGSTALLALLLPGFAASAAAPAARASERPAPELRAVWLRFHELELCQGIDAVFAFEEKRLEAWCLVEDEKSYQRFLELVEPLRASFQVAVYTTRPTPEKRGSDDKDPPPSLWTNAEIRDYLQDPFGRGGSGGVAIRPGPRSEGGDPDLFLKQRMSMFAEQTLDWGKRMKRFAADLPELALVGFGPKVESELRARGAAAALAHAQGVDRYAEKIAENVVHALPKATRRFRPREATRGAASAPSPPIDAAVQLAGAARSIARRVYRFIHPMNHTVGLVDLREPSLIDSLQTLRKMTADFVKSAERRGNRTQDSGLRIQGGKR